MSSSDGRKVYFIGYGGFVQACNKGFGKGGFFHTIKAWTFYFSGDKIETDVEFFVTIFTLKRRKPNVHKTNP